MKSVQTYAAWVHQKRASIIHKPIRCGIIFRAALWVLCRYLHKTHSTGHESRLNREGVTQLCPFGSTNYSKEELVAELGAAFLNTFTGIADDTLLDNSASYLKGWLKPLRDDKKFIFWAAKEAQKAVQFIAPVLSDLPPDPLD